LSFFRSIPVITKHGKMMVKILKTPGYRGGFMNMFVEEP